MAVADQVIRCVKRIGQTVPPRSPWHKRATQGRGYASPDSGEIWSGEARHSDHRTSSMTEAVVTRRTEENLAEADVLTCPDDE